MFRRLLDQTADDGETGGDSEPTGTPATTTNDENVSRDGWRQNIESRLGTVETGVNGLTESVSGIGKQVSEGFEWLRNLTAEPAGEPSSESSEEETPIVVQDRQPTKVQKGRARVNLGNLLRKRQ